MCAYEPGGMAVGASSVGAPAPEVGAPTTLPVHGGGVRNSVPNEGHTIVQEGLAFETLASFGLAVHPQRCVRLRNRRSKCTRCADACTSGAISLQDGAWKLDPSLCVGCGTCATVCPTCALEARHPSDAVLLRECGRSVRDGRVTVCCERVDPEAVAADAANGDSQVRPVQVVCLSRLEETLLFDLRAKGITQVVGLHGDCESCPRRQGLASISLVQETVEKVCQAWGLEDFYQVEQVPATLALAPAATQDASPDALASASSQDASPRETGFQPAAAELTGGECLGMTSEGHVQAWFKPTHVQKDGTLPHFVPERRRRLLDTLAELGEPVQPEMDTRLWGHVLLNTELCRACRMCAVFCPTGALCRYDTEPAVRDQAPRAEFGIEHYLAECVHCRLCQDICPANAIVCTTKVPTQQLASGETERYPMPEPQMIPGPHQMLRRMQTMIGGNSVEHSY